MKTYLCSHLVNLRAQGRKFYANLEKISERNATVNAEEALETGDPVTMAAAGMEMHGRVSGCKADPFGHLIDIALDAPWSRDEFEPDHFTDPDFIVEARQG